MIYSISDTNLRIYDSYRYGKRTLRSELAKLKTAHPGYGVWHRSLSSMTAEWAVHNALYRLHIFRSHTADVDLNRPNRFACLYMALYPLAYLIIK